MTPNEYQVQAMRFLNPALSERDILINGVMGLCGEAGEVIDLVKKHLAQGHPLDRTALAGELGDVAWYLAETAHVLGFTLEDAARDLNNLNIQFNLLEKVVTDGSAVNGCVISTEPAAGEKVTGTVNVYYALTVTGDEGSDEDGNG